MSQWALLSHDVLPTLGYRRSSSGLTPDEGIRGFTTKLNI